MAIRTRGTTYHSVSLTTWVSVRVTGWDGGRNNGLVWFRSTQYADLNVRV